MESEYLLNISENGRTARSCTKGGEALADEASKRLQRKCLEGRPFIAIQIKNPRFIVKD